MRGRLSPWHLLAGAAALLLAVVLLREYARPAMTLALDALAACF